MSNFVTQGVMQEELQGLTAAPIHFSATTLAARHARILTGTAAKKPYFPYSIAFPILLVLIGAGAVMLYVWYQKHQRLLALRRRMARDVIRHFGLMPNQMTLKKRKEEYLESLKMVKTMLEENPSSEVLKRELQKTLNAVYHVESLIFEASRNITIEDEALPTTYPSVNVSAYNFNPTLQPAMGLEFASTSGNVADHSNMGASSSTSTPPLATNAVSSLVAFHIVDGKVEPVGSLTSESDSHPLSSATHTAQHASSELSISRLLEKRKSETLNDTGLGKRLKSEGTQAVFGGKDVGLQTDGDTIVSNSDASTLGSDPDTDKSAVQEAVTPGVLPDAQHSTNKAREPEYPTVLQPSSKEKLAEPQVFADFDGGIPYYDEPSMMLGRFGVANPAATATSVHRIDPLEYTPALAEEGMVKYDVSTMLAEEYGDWSHLNVAVAEHGQNVTSLADPRMGNSRWEELAHLVELETKRPPSSSFSKLRKKLSHLCCKTKMSAATEDGSALPPMTGDAEPSGTDSTALADPQSTHVMELPSKAEPRQSCYQCWTSSSSVPADIVDPGYMPYVEEETEVEESVVIQNPLFVPDGGDQQISGSFPEASLESVHAEEPVERVTFSSNEEQHSRDSSLDSLPVRVSYAQGGLIPFRGLSEPGQRVLPSAAYQDISPSVYPQYNPNPRVPGEISASSMRRESMCVCAEEHAAGVLLDTSGFCSMCGKPKVGYRKGQFICRKCGKEVGPGNFCECSETESGDHEDGAGESPGDGDSGGPHPAHKDKATQTDLWGFWGALPPATQSPSKAPDVQGPSGGGRAVLQGETQLDHVRSVGVISGEQPAESLHPMTQQLNQRVQVSIRHDASVDHVEMSRDSLASSEIGQRTQDLATPSEKSSHSGYQKVYRHLAAASDPRHRVEDAQLFFPSKDRLTITEDVEGMSHSDHLSDVAGHEEQSEAGFHMDELDSQTNSGHSTGAASRIGDASAVGGRDKAKEELSGIVDTYSGHPEGISLADYVSDAVETGSEESSRRSSFSSGSSEKTTPTIMSETESKPSGTEAARSEEEMDSQHPPQFSFMEPSSTDEGPAEPHIKFAVLDKDGSMHIEIILIKPLLEDVASVESEDEGTPIPPLQDAPEEVLLRMLEEPLASSMPDELPPVEEPPSPNDPAEVLLAILGDKLTELGGMLVTEEAVPMDGEPSSSADLSGEASKTLTPTRQSGTEFLESTLAESIYDSPKQNIQSITDAPISPDLDLLEKVSTPDIPTSVDFFDVDAGIRPSVNSDQHTAMETLDSGVFFEKTELVGQWSEGTSDTSPTSNVPQSSSTFYYSSPTNLMLEGEDCLKEDAEESDHGHVATADPCGKGVNVSQYHAPFFQLVSFVGLVGNALKMLGDSPNNKFTGERVLHTDGGAQNISLNPQEGGAIHELPPSGTEGTKVNVEVQVELPELDEGEGTKSVDPCETFSEKAATRVTEKSEDEDPSMVHQTSSASTSLGKENWSSQRHFSLGAASPDVDKLQGSSGIEKKRERGVDKQDIWSVGESKEATSIEEEESSSSSRRISAAAVDLRYIVQGPKKLQKIEGKFAPAHSGSGHVALSKECSKQGTVGDDQGREQEFYNAVKEVVEAYLKRTAQQRKDQYSEANALSEADEGFYATRREIPVEDLGNAPAGHFTPSKASETASTSDLAPLSRRTRRVNSEERQRSSSQETLRRNYPKKKRLPHRKPWKFDQKFDMFSSDGVLPPSRYRKPRSQAVRRLERKVLEEMQSTPALRCLPTLTRINLMDILDKKIATQSQRRIMKRKITTHHISLDQELQRKKASQQKISYGNVRL